MSIEHSEAALQSEPIVATIDISEGWDTESIRDIVIERLKDLGIYQPNLLFRGFDGDKIEVLKQNGTDTPTSLTTYCSKESELADEYAMEQSALNFALSQKKAGLAVYDGNKLEQKGKIDVVYEYRAKEGITLQESLLAVLILE